MAHLWVQHENKWAVLPLTSHCYDVAAVPPRSTVDWAEDRAEGWKDSPVLLLQSGHEWVLLSVSGARVRVNGLPLMANISVLAGGDEIVLSDNRMFFSTEVLAKIAPHAGKVVRCPRCKLELKEGQSAVRCPACQAAHHEACWSYGSTCSICPAPTPLDAGYQFTPEELGCM
jgi:hypothetical protein